MEVQPAESMATTAPLDRALDALYKGMECLPKRDDTSDTRTAMAEAIIAVLEERGARLRLEPNDAA